MNDFLENLKSELKYQDLTQKELAQKSGISINTIRGWFSKNLAPDVFNAFKVAKALNVSVEYLVTGKDENEAAKQLTELKAKLAELIMFK